MLSILSAFGMVVSIYRLKVCLGSKVIPRILGLRTVGSVRWFIWIKCAAELV